MNCPRYGLKISFSYLVLRSAGSLRHSSFCRCCPLWHCTRLALFQRRVVQYAILLPLLGLGMVTASEDKEFGSGKLAKFHVVPGTGRIQDQYGRERIFHGLNVVMKGAPWHPDTEAFDARLSFSDTDIALLKEWGMNVVRLAIMWPGVEPKRGHINSTYLQIMRSIVGKLHSAGIYSLLEFHQDLFSSQFCGEGLPAWVIDEASSGYKTGTVRDYLSNEEWKREERDVLKYSARKTNPQFSQITFDRNEGLPVSMLYPASFPEPLSRRWPSEWEKDGWEPSAEQCGKHTWFWYYFSYAVSRAFQDLYDNRWGWADLLARYWTVVAEAFRIQPGVLGYELINEPWPGDIFRDPFLLVPGVADRKNLARFYDKLQAAVRSVDWDRILFIETVTYDDFRFGFSHIPGGHQFRNRTVLSYHYYRPPNFTPHQAFAERLRESKKLGCGAMLTEFFIAKKIDRSGRWKSTDSNEPHHQETNGEFQVPAYMGAWKKNLEQRSLRTEDRGNWEDGFDDWSKDSVDDVLSEADAHVQSWIGWEYKAFFNKTGSDVQQSLFLTDGNVNLVLARQLARTYPQAVLGHIKSFAFNPSSGEFQLMYVAGDQGPHCCTEVYVHRPFYYPSGLNVSVHVDRNCTSIRETENLVFIAHSSVCVGLIIDVRISKRTVS